MTDADAIRIVISVMKDEVSRTRKEYQNAEATLDFLRRLLVHDDGPDANKSK